LNGYISAGVNEVIPHIFNSTASASGFRAVDKRVAIVGRDSGTHAKFNSREASVVGRSLSSYNGEKQKGYGYQG
jgi:hypothetical protein